MEYRYQTSECMPRLYPIVVFCGTLHLGNNKEPRMINRGNYLRGEWGNATAPTIIDKHTYPFPVSLSMKWGSMTEGKAYELESSLQKEKIEKLWQQKDKDGNALYDYIVVGCAPYGGVAVWLNGFYKTVLVDWLKGTEVAEEEVEDYLMGLSLKDYCQLSVNQDVEVKNNLEKNGLPPSDLYDNWMRQYNYRYVGLEEYFDGEKWQLYDEEDLYFDDMDFDSIQDQRFDGTHDLLHDGGLMNYHEAGCPKRIAIVWYEGRDEFSAYYWFDEEKTPLFFSQFFMMSGSRKADARFRIDTRANQYEIVLTSDMVTEPQVLPLDAYQLLVFQNDNEYYRSENFAQEDGAWEW